MISRKIPEKWNREITNPRKLFEALIPSIYLLNNAF